MQKKKENISGNIRIDGDKIAWEYRGANMFEINVKDIVLIGEYTNGDGPYFDDWFITFVTKDGHWQSIPLYADNRTNLLDYLCERFQPDFSEILLTGSFEWNSVVRYPKQLKGKPLFKLVPTENYKAPKTFFDKILSSVGIGGFDTTNSVDLTEDVKKDMEKILL